MAVGSRALRVALLGLVLTGLPPLTALAQHSVVDVYLDRPISLYDPAIFTGPQGQALAGFLPRYLEQPMDDLTPRPGALGAGMGGAHVALAEGPMSLGWNPAGLGLMTRGAISLDGLVRSSKGTGTNLPDTVVVRGLGGFQPQTYTEDLTAGRAFEFFGGAAPLVRLGSRPLVGGIAFRRHTDISFGQATLLEMRLFGSSSTGFPFVLGLDNKERGSIQALTLGLGYEALRLPGGSLSLGGTANFLTGRLRSDVQVRAAVRNFTEGRVTFQRDYKGFTVEGGALATAMEGRVRVGGWVGLPNRIETSNSSFTGLRLGLPDDTEIDRVHGTIADYDLELPLLVSFGAAVGPFRGLQLAADVNVRPWSKMKVKHGDPAFQQFDADKIASDVTSYHVGGRFEFPILRRRLHSIGMRLDTLVGYRTLPLSQRERSLLNGQAPFFTGDQIEGSATDFGFTLATGTEVTLQFGVELQSYEFSNWFLEDQRDLTRDPHSGDPIHRELGFSDPFKEITRIKQRNTLFRISAEMAL